MLWYMFTHRYICSSYEDLSGTQWSLSIPFTVGCVSSFHHLIPSAYMILPDHVPRLWHVNKLIAAVIYNIPQPGILFITCFMFVNKMNLEQVEFYFWSFQRECSLGVSYYVCTFFSKDIITLFCVAIFSFKKINFNIWVISFIRKERWFW